MGWNTKTDVKNMMARVLQFLFWIKCSSTTRPMEFLPWSKTGLARLETIQTFARRWLTGKNLRQKTLNLLAIGDGSNW